MVEQQALEPILQFFRWEHLPEHLRAASRPFGELADHIVSALPRNPERTVALRKLLEAKDAAVRAAVCATVFTDSSIQPQVSAQPESPAGRTSPAPGVTGAGEDPRMKKMILDAMLELATGLGELGDALRGVRPLSAMDALHILTHSDAILTLLRAVGTKPENPNG